MTRDIADAIQDFDADICIVGAGITAGLLAHKLGRAGVRCLLLEAGPRHPPEERFERMQRLLRGDDPWRTENPKRDVYVNAGPFDYQINNSRVKAVGGSTLHWAGYTPRFVANDFRMRSRSGIGADWPISYQELEPYYTEAERELGVAGAQDNPFASPRSADYPLPAFPIGYDERLLLSAGGKLGIAFHSLPQARTSAPYRGRSQCVTFSACRACPVRARYSADIHIESAEATGNVMVIADAPVFSLETTAAGHRIVRAVFTTGEGEQHAVTAPVFVVAAHAIESARLLLHSSGPSHPNGLGNSSDLVGRYFMEHRSQHRVFTLNQPLYPDRKGFATALSQQFHDHAERSERSGFTISGIALGANYEPLVDKLAVSSGNWGEAFASELEEQVARVHQSRLMIRTTAEPLPSVDNRVDLDPDVKDSFGVPAPRLHYDISEYERTAYVPGLEVIDAMGDELSAISRSDVQYHFGSHHAGTCRMGNDPAESVVNRDLRTHDVDNLYVAGSSAFVSLSLVNPTLTIAALALRLGDHLLEQRHK